MITVELSLTDPGLAITEDSRSKAASWPPPNGIDHDRCAGARHHPGLGGKRSGTEEESRETQSEAWRKDLQGR